MLPTPLEPVSKKLVLISSIEYTKTNPSSEYAKVKQAYIRPTPTANMGKTPTHIVCNTSPLIPPEAPELAIVLFHTLSTSTWPICTRC